MPPSQPSAPSPAVRLIVDATDGRVALRDGVGGVWMAPCWAAVVFTDGRVQSTEGAARPETGVDGLVIRTAGSDQFVELRWHMAPRPREQALAMWLEVHNTTNVPQAIERLDVLVAPQGFKRAPLEAMAISRTGWQSWSHATPPIPWTQQPAVAPSPIVSAMQPPAPASGLDLPWMAALEAPDGHSLLAGFVSARDQHSGLSLQPAVDGHRLVASSYPEGLVLPPGGTLASELLLLIVDTPTAVATARYAEELAREQAARVPDTAPTGWCSWYDYFTNVTAQDVLANLDVLDAHRATIPVTLVQLDDGYQTAVGDWLSLNPKFPDGLRALTDTIHARGYQAGLWFAPFLVAEDSAVYLEHPDWVLKDSAGLPLLACYNWDRRNYALDVTQPEVEAWLRRVVRTMVDDWGFDYLKIDFIYAGALRASRHQSGVTSVQAYRRGLAIIREEAGARFILGCGAPFAPSIGLVDGMRVSPDTAPAWASDDSAGSAPSLQNAIRSTLAHGWMHQRFWINDPDCLIVRGSRSELTGAEVETWAAVVALSGGMVLLSDDLSRLEPDRLAMLPRMLPPLGQAAEPHGPFVAGLPTRATLPVERDWAHWRIEACFNWDDAPATLSFDPGDASPYIAFDLWRGVAHGPFNGPLTLQDVPAHGVRLLEVHRLTGVPQVVGVTAPLLGSAVALATLTLSDEALYLRARGEVGEVWLWLPAGYALPDTQGPALVALPLPKDGDLRLELTRF